MAGSKLGTGTSAIEERLLASDAELTMAPIGSSYCLPERTDLVVARLKPTENELLYRICDARGNLVFYATCDNSNFNIWEASDDGTVRPIVHMKGELLNGSRCETRRWKAYRDESEHVRDGNDSGLLFTVIQSTKKARSSFELIVPNREGDLSVPPRYTTRTRLFGRGFRIVLRNTSNRRPRLSIANVRRWKTFRLPCCNFREEGSKIRISAGVDRAFVASIFVLVDAARHQRRSSSCPTVAESPESPIAVGIPAYGLDSRGINLQRVSHSENAFQAYSSYHDMYAFAGALQH